MIITSRHHAILSFYSFTYLFKFYSNDFQHQSADDSVYGAMLSK